MRTIVAMSLATALGLFMAWRGPCVPLPEMKPVSIREGSARGPGAGGRPVYFMGRGIHSGK